MPDPVLPTHAWYAVAHESAVVGVVGVVLHGQRVALFRGPSGVGAWVDRCPHRHASLSQGSVQQGQVVCPYHGWRFDENGACTAIPGLVEGVADQPNRRLTAVACVVQDGLVWISVDGVPPSAPPVLPACGKGRVQRIEWSFLVNCDPVDAIENFLDPMHTHTIHSGLVRTEGRRSPVSVQITGLPGGVEARYVEARQSGSIARWFGADIAVSFGRYWWPGVAQLEYRDGSGAIKMVITACFSPGERGTQVTAVVVGVPPWWLPGWVARAVISPLFRRTVAQDRRILEAVAEQRSSADRPYAMSGVDFLRPHIDRLLAQPDRLTPSTPKEIQVEL